MEIYQKVEAIKHIMHDADFSVLNGDTIIWNDTRSMPTDGEIQEAYDDIKVIYDNYLKDIACQEWILANYPLTKQNSDSVDKSFWESTLKDNCYPYLDKVVMVYIKRFINYGTKYSDIMLAEPEATRDEVGQLVKCGIRLNWVIDCKKALAISKKDGTPLILPDFPVID